MRDYQIDWDKIINTILLIVTMGVLVVAVIGAIGAIKNNSNYIWCQSNYIYETVPEQVNLYAGNNDFQLSGEWSIFGGRVDTEDVVFYWVNENGVLSKHNAPMSQSTFIEDGKNQLLIFELHHSSK